MGARTGEAWSLFCGQGESTRFLTSQNPPVRNLKLCVLRPGNSPRVGERIEAFSSEALSPNGTRIVAVDISLSRRQGFVHASFGPASTWYASTYMQWQT